MPLMNGEWQLRQSQPALEDGLLKAGYDPIIARLLSQRGVSDAEAGSFCSADYADMSKPEEFPGVSQVAKILLDAAKNPSGVLVAAIGDYDVDGITSAVELKLICVALGLRCDVFLPSRHEHGYGLNPKTLAAFINFIDRPPDILFVLDCGTSSESEIAELKAFGVRTVVVIDHHIPKPAAFSHSADVIINWRLPGWENEMCTAGEVFMLAGALRRQDRRIKPASFLSLAAVATVADISPLRADNRILVRKGLTALNSSASSGLRMLAAKCGASGGGMTQEDVSFRLAPRLNSVGRIDVPYTAYDLLMGGSEKGISEMIAEIEAKNAERRALQGDMVDGAIAQAAAAGASNGILLVDESWNPGIVGIAAMKIVERFHVPTVLVGSSNGVLKGSGRSVPGVSIEAVLEACSELFESHGGHEMACGVVLKRDRAADAGRVFNKACGEFYDRHGRPFKSRLYDLSLKPSSVTEDLAIELRKTLYPYCQTSNPEPIFRLPDVFVNEMDVRDGKGWKLTKLRLGSYEYDIPMQFKSFELNLPEDVKGRMADVYFKFPQSFQDRYGPEPSVVDVVFHK